MRMSDVVHFYCPSAGRILARIADRRSAMAGRPNSRRSTPCDTHAAKLKRCLLHVSWVTHERVRVRLTAMRHETSYCADHSDAGREISHCLRMLFACRATTNTPRVRFDLSQSSVERGIR